MTSLSLAEARRLALHAQGLLRDAPFGAGPSAAVEVIRRLGYVQIDTISIVERAHHHVLWSRVPDYEPGWLGELQAPKRGGAPRIFEYWSHAAAYLPVEDYRYCLPRMERLAKGARHWFARDRKVMSAVLDRIRAEGPLMARDFEAPEGARSGPWFDWKPAKKALEQLFMEGKLMIRERRGFQKVYDLAERVLPPGVERDSPAPREMARYLATRTLRAHGIAREEEMRYLRKGMQKAMKQALRELEEERAIVRVGVEAPVSRRGEGKNVFYADPALLEEPLGPVKVARARLLSPFDNAVIQRKRLGFLFGYDYQIECYVPAPKRRFGYFCLPLLFGDRFIGRVDAKVDRPNRRLDALKVILEPGVKHKGAVREEIALELERFARFNGAEQVRIAKIETRP